MRLLEGSNMKVPYHPISNLARWAFCSHWASHRAIEDSWWSYQPWDALPAMESGVWGRLASWLTAETESRQQQGTESKCVIWRRGRQSRQRSHMQVVRSSHSGQGVCTGSGVKVLSPMGHCPFGRLWPFGCWSLLGYGLVWRSGVKLSAVHSGASYWRLCLCTAVARRECSPQFCRWKSSDAFGCNFKTRS